MTREVNRVRYFILTHCSISKFTVKYKYISRCILKWKINITFLLTKIVFIEKGREMKVEKVLY